MADYQDYLIATNNTDEELDEAYRNLYTAQKYGASTPDEDDPKAVLEWFRRNIV